MGLDFLIEADGSMNAGVYAPLYEAGSRYGSPGTAGAVEQRSGYRKSVGDHGKRSGKRSFESIIPRSGRKFQACRREQPLRHEYTEYKRVSKE